MPKLRPGTAKSHLYFRLGGWLVYKSWLWSGEDLEKEKEWSLPDEGWKLHVSGKTSNAQRILDKVLPVLREGNVHHKFLPSTEDLEHHTVEQTGKLVTVYPVSLMAAFLIVSEMDNALVDFSKNMSPTIPDERWVGKTIVYTRYGAFVEKLWNPTEKRLVGDCKGIVHPKWIKDPWGYYPNIMAVIKFKSWPNHRRMEKKYFYKKHLIKK